MVLRDNKHEGGDCENGKFAQSPIRSKDFKTTFFTVAPFMIQLMQLFNGELVQRLPDGDDKMILGGYQ